MDTKHKCHSNVMMSVARHSCSYETKVHYTSAITLKLYRGITGILVLYGSGTGVASSFLQEHPNGSLHGPRWAKPHYMPSSHPNELDMALL
jgi:hypothetical protein